MKKAEDIPLDFAVLMVMLVIAMMKKKLLASKSEYMPQAQKH